MTKKKILGIAGVSAALILFGCVIGASSSQNTSTPQSEQINHPSSVNLDKQATSSQAAEQKQTANVTETQAQEPVATQDSTASQPATTQKQPATSQSTTSQKPSTAAQPTTTQKQPATTQKPATSTTQKPQSTSQQSQTTAQKPTTSTNSTPGNSSCVIKGNISTKTGEKIYHVPGQQYYNSTKIDTSKGERWFCSEADAVRAGWRKSKR